MPGFSPGDFVSIGEPPADSGFCCSVMLASIVPGSTGSMGAALGAAVAIGGTGGLSWWQGGEETKKSPSLEEVDSGETESLLSESISSDSWSA